MTMKVINGTVYADNPYQKILYSALSGQFACVKGTAQDAVSAQEKLESGASQIFHVHWEEAVIRPFKTETEAKLASLVFVENLKKLKDMGGKIVWTVHNLSPHEQEHPQAFEMIRQALFQYADKILIHATSAISELSKQGDVTPEKFFLLPHPSYADFYKVPKTTKGPKKPEARKKSILIFGKIRRYKAIHTFIEHFAKSDLHEQGYTLRVCGEPLKTDDYGAFIEKNFSKTPGVSLEFRRFNDEELRPLFVSCSCLILPYERFLTSGVLLAAMTLGLPVVAPNLPQIREVLPTSQHSFLYNKDKISTSIASIKKLSNLNLAIYDSMVDDMIDRAEYYAPHKISTMLGQLYQSLR